MCPFPLNFHAVQCQPGTSVQSGWCVYCDKGTYQDSLGQSDCTLCPAGKTTDIVGARSVDECIGEYRMYPKYMGALWDLINLVDFFRPFRRG